MNYTSHDACVQKNKKKIKMVILSTIFQRGKYSVWVRFFGHQCSEEDKVSHGWAPLPAAPRISGVRASQAEHHVIQEAKHVGAAPSSITRRRNSLDGDECSCQINFQA